MIAWPWPRSPVTVPVRVIAERDRRRVERRGERESKRNWMRLHRGGGPGLPSRARAEVTPPSSGRSSQSRVGLTGLGEGRSSFPRGPGSDPALTTSAPGNAPTGAPASSITRAKRIARSSWLLAPPLCHATAATIAQGLFHQRGIHMLQRKPRGGPPLPSGRSLPLRRPASHLQPVFLPLPSIRPLRSRRRELICPYMVIITIPRSRLF